MLHTPPVSADAGDAPARAPRRAYPSDLSRSARRRRQRDEAREHARQVGDRQQIARDLAAQLEGLGRQAQYSDYTDLLNKLALSVRTRGASTPDRDADAVLDAGNKKLPARTLAEYASETGLLKDDVKKILSSMVATGVMREVKRPGASTEYFPTGRQCGDVLP